MSVLDYIKEKGAENVSEGMIAYWASLEKVAETAPNVAASIVKELESSVRI